MLNIHPGIPQHIASAVYWVGNVSDDIGSIFPQPKLPRFRTGKPHKMSHVKNWVVVGRRVTNYRPIYGERRLLADYLTERQAKIAAAQLAEKSRYYKNIVALPEAETPASLFG